MKQLANISLMDGWFPTVLFSITGIAIAFLVFTKSKRGKYWIPLAIQLGAAFASLIVGGLIAWLISDVFLVFGVSLGWLVIFAISAGFAFLGFAIATAFMSKGIRLVVCVLASLLTILCTMLCVDMVYGEYTTIGSLFGWGSFPALKESEQNAPTTTISQWKALYKSGKIHVRTQGIVRSVHIPATESNFKARTANIYLPPAALSKHAPKLPVMVMLAGQPGSPTRFFSASNIASMLNEYAKNHSGLAPIVISPDQNGSSSHNSLCADTPVFGKAETYLTKDVPNWIKKHLPVSEDPKLWLMGGFSQGGTCATQLVPAHPDIFSSMYSAGGEIEPTWKDENQTISKYFNGNKKAYESHIPEKIMRKNAPLKQNYYAIAGLWDPKSQSNQSTISITAHKSGMRVITMLAQKSGHDWHTVQAGLHVVIDQFCKQAGISDTTAELNSYADVKILNDIKGK